MSLQPHQQRVVDEWVDLEGKIGRLDVFVGGDVFNSLPESDRDLLVQQLEVMRHYAGILGKRVERFA